MTDTLHVDWSLPESYGNRTDGPNITGIDGFELEIYVLLCFPFSMSLHLIQLN